MVHVRKSALDFRAYRYLKLENGLKVLLISSCDYEPRKKKRAIDEHVPSALVAPIDHAIKDSLMETVVALSHTGLNPANYFAKNRPREAQDSGPSCGFFPELTEKQKLAACRATKEDDASAYVSLVVGVGYFSDPKKFPGLAHLLEHLLLMGCPEYPNSSYFDKFLQFTGGTPWNGNTDGCRTVFYYDTSADYLAESLHILVSHLKEPNFSPNDIEKERVNVDSEFRKAIPHHQFRFNHMLHMLASPDHPYFRFAWGNGKTLGGDARTVLKCRRALRKFHRTFYLPSTMHLVIQAPETLDSLQRMVQQAFCKLGKYGGCDNISKTIDFRELPQPFSNTKFRRLYKILARTNVERLSITWQLPPNAWKRYRVKPLDYLTYILLNEFKCGLIYYLKENGFITTVTTNGTETSFERSNACTLYTLHFELTKKGLYEYFEIVSAVFSYLKLLKQEGPQSEIFLELSRLKAAEFHYVRESEPAIRIKEISEAMRIYEPEDILSGPLIMPEYDAVLIKNTVEALDTCNFNLMIFSKTFKKVANNLEKYFGIRYTSQALTEEEIEHLRTIPVYRNFSLCNRNPFIPSDFSIVPPVCPEDVETLFPIKLGDDFTDIWFLQDDGSINPQASFTFGLLSPLANSSCLNAVMTDLFLEALLLRLSGGIYFATAAMMEVELQRVLKGIQIRISGFSDKLLTLFEKIIEKISKVGYGFSSKEFDLVAFRLARNYEKTLEEPCQLASDLRRAAAYQDYCMISDRYMKLKKFCIDPTEFTTFTQEFRAKLSIRGFLAGNVNRKTVKSVQQILRRYLRYERIRIQEFPKNRANQFSCGETCLRVRSNSVDGDVTLVKNIYQTAANSTVAKVISEYLAMTISEPLFHYLRTERQLSYSPEIIYRQDFGLLTLQIHLISPADKFSPGEINKAVDDFLVKFYEDTIAKLTPAKFKETRSLAIAGLEHKMAAVGEQEQDWEKLATEDVDLQAVSKEKEVWQKLTRENIICFYERFLLHPNYLQERIDQDITCSEFRKLSIQVVGLRANERKKQAGSVPEYDLKYLPGREAGIKFITDVNKFKSKLCTYPARF